MRQDTAPILGDMMMFSLSGVFAAKYLSFVLSWLGSTLGSFTPHNPQRLPTI